MTRSARLRYWIDRQEIHDCIQRVSRAIDRFDRVLFVSAYHEDAVIDAGGLVADPGTVYDVGAALHAHGQRATLHHLTNHSCELDGDEAHAETYFLYVGRNHDGSNWLAGGRYADRLERREGNWGIAFRLTMIEWSGEMPSNAVPLFDGIPDLQANGFAARDRRDPSYRRPLRNQRARRIPADVTRLSRPEV